MEILFVAIALVFVSVIILLILLLVAGISSAFGTGFQTVFVNGLWVLLLPPVIVLAGYLFGRNSLAVNHIEVGSESVPPAFDGYRIVQISDMHLRSFRDRPEVLLKIIGRVNAENPDLIVFSGDLVTTHPDEILPFMDMLGQLEAEDGVVSVMGNHGSRTQSVWPPLIPCAAERGGSDGIFLTMRI